MKKIILLILVLFSNPLYAGSGSKYCTFIEGIHKGEHTSYYNDTKLFSECISSNNSYYQRKYDECTANKICLAERKRADNLFSMCILILGLFVFFAFLLMVKELNSI